MEKIIVKNAYENNLKHLDLEIPLNKFTCVTGCSGCGKSSLVYDTIYAESQRAFLEGMTGNIYGQKLMDRPHVGSIENLRPTINISQNCYNVNPRSTIGTTTEISYYIRSLFSIVNSNQVTSVSEKVFSANNPNSFCPNCMGLGVETVVSESLLVPDRNITLRNGAILYFKGTSEGKEQKILQALCEYYNIDIDKKFSELSNDEVNNLMYSDGKDEYVKIQIKDNDEIYVNLTSKKATKKQPKEEIRFGYGGFYRVLSSPTFITEAYKDDRKNVSIYWPTLFSYKKNDYQSRLTDSDSKPEDSLTLSILKKYGFIVVLKENMTLNDSITLTKMFFPDADSFYWSIDEKYTKSGKEEIIRTEEDFKQVIKEEAIEKEFKD